MGTKTVPMSDELPPKKTVVLFLFLYFESQKTFEECKEDTTLR
jgi:hypothetical protein